MWITCCENPTSVEKFHCHSKNFRLYFCVNIEFRGISHITGGGFYENIPRCIPDGLCAKIEKKALRIPPIFPLLSRMGGISERDMFNTFNMGTGMVLVAAKDSADKALAALHSLGQEAGVIGEIVSGEEKVALC